MRFKKKVAMVTGAGGGIGRAIALALAREGVDLVLNDIASESLDGLADEMKVMTSRLFVGKADVTKCDEVVRMVRGALDEFGGMDIMSRS
jgi:meso-butanediol dehydrogenase/(S,S)-butanediol dehydrogenase/diacetyl reductase